MVNLKNGEPDILEFEGQYEDGKKKVFGNITTIMENYGIQYHIKMIRNMDIVKV